MTINSSFVFFGSVSSVTGLFSTITMEQRFASVRDPRSQLDAALQHTLDTNTFVLYLTLSMIQDP